MTTLKNSEVLERILRALFSAASRRTTQSFAATVIGAIIKTLEQNYEFLQHVHVENPEYVNIEGIIRFPQNWTPLTTSKSGKLLKRLSE